MDFSSEKYDRSAQQNERGCPTALSEICEEQIPPRLWVKKLSCIKLYILSTSQSSRHQISLYVVLVIQETIAPMNL